MAKVIYSDELPIDKPQAATSDEQLWIYNALDNCITFEVWEHLKEEEQVPFPYLMGRAMQGPALTLMRRGIKINLVERGRLITDFTTRHEKYTRWFSRLTGEGIGEVINPQSPQQLKKLFYELLHCDPIRRYDKTKRERVLTCNREALEKLVLIPKATIFAKLLLEIRDLTKRLQFLKSGIDKDNRVRSSYSTTGTETGRWSSSKNVRGTGTNMQNVTDEMRRLFEADKGKKLGSFDLKQAESVVVAALSNDPRYIEACRSGDPHTYVCELVWPELPWNGANDPDPKAIKKYKRSIAERSYYRHFSHRDIAKKGGHGGNYGGTDTVLAMHLKVPRAVAKEFLDRYFGPKGFPGIRMWQLKIQQKIAATRMLTTPLGRRRYFLGRPTDSTTIKEAIAYEPQSTIGDVLNLGLFRVWLYMDIPGKIELLGQVHDSILFQYDPADEAAILAEVAELLVVPIQINGKEWRIGTDAQVGWNWGKVKEKDGKVINPHGLRDWTGSDDREAPPKASQLDRLVCDVHRLF